MDLASAKALVAERDALDKKIDEQEQILRHCGADMKTELVDAEGFPRADIDVYSIRHARSKIIHLRNDREALTEKIAQAMNELSQSGDVNMNSTKETKKIVHRTSNEPFVRISTVTAGSPADLGGLKTEDQVIQFDELHHGNFSKMKQLAEAVAQNENLPMNVTVIRNHRPLRLQITPRRWSSAPNTGTLGCAFLPIPK